MGVAPLPRASFNTLPAYQTGHLHIIKPQLCQHKATLVIYHAILKYKELYSYLYYCVNYGVFEALEA